MRNIRQQITENLIPVFRRKLSGVDALPQLAVLGLLSGIVTGAVILLFRLAIEWPLEHFLPGAGSENFEQLDILTRGLLPLAGAVGLGILLHKLSIHDRKPWFSLLPGLPPWYQASRQAGRARQCIWAPRFQACSGNG
jgi:CIC family chloride channel protein